jgi:hypothetical protein
LEYKLLKAKHNILSKSSLEATTRQPNFEMIQTKDNLFPIIAFKPFCNVERVILFFTKVRTDSFCDEQGLKYFNNEILPSAQLNSLKKYYENTKDFSAELESRGRFELI